MKVVRTDNFGKSGKTPGYDETFVAQTLSPREADAVAKVLNRLSLVNDPFYYFAVDDDYKLAVFSA